MRRPPRRDQAERAFLEVARARIHGILPGNEDQNRNDLSGLIGVSVHYPADEAGTTMPTWTLHAPVGDTCVSSRHSERRVGHIDRSGHEVASPLVAVLYVCHHRPVNVYQGSEVKSLPSSGP